MINKEKVIKGLKFLAIMILLTIIISEPYLNQNNLTTHDISYHINRIVCISEELRLGNFPVLIHSRLLNGFGYANSLFYPELFLYIPAILCLIGSNVLFSYKILIMISTFATLLIAFYSVYGITKNKTTAWIGTLLYTTSFYRMADIYERGAIGEVLAITFIPLLVYGLYEIVFGDNKKWWVIPIGFFGIVNSHVLTYALSTAILIILCMVNVVTIFKDKKKIINIALAGFISIFISMSFVMQYMEQSLNDKYNVDEFIYDGNFMEKYAVSFDDMINNEFYKGDFYKGIGTIAIVISAFIFKCDKNDKRKFMIQIYVVGMICLILSTSLINWIKLGNTFRWLTIMQFPYRLNIISSAFLSLVSAYVLGELFKDKKELVNIFYIIYIIYVIFIISTIDENKLNYDYSYIINSTPTGNSEYEPYGLDISDTYVYNTKNPDEKIEYIRHGNQVSFDYNEKDLDFEIRIPLTYYKGYVSYIMDTNGNKTKLDLVENPYNKTILIRSNEKLTGNVIVEYKMTIIQIIGYTITWITVIGLSIYIIYEQIIKKIKKYNEKE